VVDDGFQVGNIASIVSLKRIAIHIIYIVQVVKVNN